MTLLSGCGGGGVASNTTEPLAVLPGTATMYYGYPTVFTITGGRKNYTVYSSDSAILPLASSSVADDTFVVSASNVAADTDVTLTVRDSDGKKVDVTITVKPATLVGTSLTVTPEQASGTGCAPAVCSGGYGLVSVRLLQFSGVANHSIRLDVMEGDYGFVSGTTTTNSITVTTDQIGYAYARFKAMTDAPTQFAILKATDLVNGSSQQTTFTIAQSTNGTGILSVVPDKHTITAYWKGECSSGIKVDYIIHGGTPPYTVQSTSTRVATVFPNTVLTNGAGFTATTQNGFCPGTVAIDIKDATGRVIQATLENLEGTNTVTVPTPVAFFTTAPAAVTVAAGETASFMVGGGTSPYYASSSDTVVATASISGSSLVITAGKSSGTATITVADSAGATKTIAVTVGSGTTAAALLVSPSAATGATGDVLNFLISGGKDPYSLTVNNPGIATGSISGSALTANLLNVGTANFIVTDSTGAQKALTITVNSAAMAFRLSPSSVTVASTSTDTITYTITGGTPPYHAYSSDTTLATVTGGAISGQTFTLTGVSKALTANATVTITVVDNLGGTATASYIKAIPAP